MKSRAPPSHQADREYIAQKYYATSRIFFQSVCISLFILWLLSTNQTVYKAKGRTLKKFILSCLKNLHKLSQLFLKGKILNKIGFFKKMKFQWLPLEIFLYLLNSHLIFLKLNISFSFTQSIFQLLSRSYSVIHSHSKMLSQTINNYMRFFTNCQLNESFCLNVDFLCVVFYITAVKNYRDILVCL